MATTKEIFKEINNLTRDVIAITSTEVLTSADLDEIATLKIKIDNLWNTVYRNPGWVDHYEHSSNYYH